MRIRSLIIFSLSFTGLSLGACQSSTSSSNGTSSGGTGGDGGTSGGSSSGAAAGTGDGGSVSSSQAYLYLQDSVATHLDINFDYVAGFQPDADALSQFNSRLTDLKTQNLLVKSNGLSLNQGKQLPANADTNHAYSQAEVEALFQANQVASSQGANAVAYIIYLDGHSDQDTSSGQILGFAFDGDRIAMFANTIRKVCAQSSSVLDQGKTCKLAEATVLVHEFGHLLGLVSNGIAMKNAHQDTAHGAHCNVKSCVMYWSVNNSSSILDVLGSNSEVPAFDQGCLDDLALAHTH